MSDHLFVLLVQNQAEPMDSLKKALKTLKFATFTVDSLNDASRLIPQTYPHLVFTEPRLADGTWLDVVRLAQTVESPMNVIVVGSNTDIKLYISAIENGAYDFVLPPFELEALEAVVRSAGDDARHRRIAQARLAVA